MNNNRVLSVEQVVSALNLEPHIEGGFFRQTFKAGPLPAVQTGKGPRVTLTSIYYLLTTDSPIGHFHRNTSHIMHYYHMGDPITYYLLYPNGELSEITLGNDLQAGQLLQFVVPGGVWKASKLLSNLHGYGLIGEAVAPGFEYKDMQLAKTNELQQQFPQHKQTIELLTRE